MLSGQPKKLRGMTGLELVPWLHPFVAADPGALLDFCAVHFAVVEVYLRCASPPFVLHVR